jgi:hypothetical protein
MNNMNNTTQQHDTNLSGDDYMELCRDCIEVYAHEDDASEPVSVYLQTDDDGKMKVYKLSHATVDIIQRRISHSFEVPFHALKHLEKQVCNWERYRTASTV